MKIRTSLDKSEIREIPETGSHTGLPTTSLIFDWMMAITSAWVIAGLFLDGWYHNTYGESIETFITPWHAVLYSGMLASGLTLGLKMIQNHRLGYPWLHSLPGGYQLSLLGFLIFAGGGGFDLTWHTLFGFEADVEALLSPAHLVLAAGGFLLITGPLRANLDRMREPGQRSWGEHLPVILTILFALSIFTFFTQFSSLYAHPSTVSEAIPGGASDRYFWDATVLSYVLVPTVVTLILILFAVKNLALPIGSLTFVLVGNALLMFGLGLGRGEGKHWLILLAALAGGMVADLYLACFRRFRGRNPWLPWLGFAQPFVTTLISLLALVLTVGIPWRIHMWLGAPLLAGVIGLGLSYLILPAEGASSEVQVVRDSQ